MAWYVHRKLSSRPEAALRESISQVYEEGVLGLFWQLAQASCPKQENGSPLPLLPWHNCLGPVQQWPKSPPVQSCTQKHHCRLPHITSQPTGPQVLAQAVPQYIDKGQQNGAEVGLPKDTARKWCSILLLPDDDACTCCYWLTA